MTLGTKKKIASCLLVLNVGATYFFFLICVLEGPPPNGWIYSWPVISVISCGSTLFYLRRYYRLEPPPPPGAWRLLLSDLIAISIVCGASFGGLKEIIPAEKFSVAGPLLASMLGLIFTSGLLAASLRGWFKEGRRFGFAFLHMLRSLGWLGVGGFLALFLLLLLIEGPRDAMGMAWDVLFSGHARRNSKMYPFILIMRFGVIFAIIGSICVRKFIRDCEWRDAMKENTPR